MPVTHLQLPALCQQPVEEHCTNHNIATGYSATEITHWTIPLTHPKFYFDHVDYNAVQEVGGKNKYIFIYKYLDLFISLGR